MAHFAELDNNNVVLRVIVVKNEVLTDADGVESEEIGKAFCFSTFGGRWVQTSYNGKIRKNYAGLGYTYDYIRNAFIPPKPYASWMLDENTCQWNAPVPYPSDGLKYQWDELGVKWAAV
jgi:hypothetical protein